MKQVTNDNEILSVDIKTLSEDVRIRAEGAARYSIKRLKKKGHPPSPESLHKARSEARRRELARKSIRDAERAAERRALGICVRCGLQKPMESKVNCETCLDKAADYKGRSKNGPKTTTRLE